ncbi:MAG: hypothetical protein ABSB24_18470 [Gaiellaceae bacterium]|jgi:hypothetical protein
MTEERAAVLAAVAALVDRLPRDSYYDDTLDLAALQAALLDSARRRRPAAPRPSTVVDSAR